jgi:hypothetical protein
MISHTHKCIFIHVPRCAGTSIETWLCGLDWWTVVPATKHLTASQAREPYAPWWDGYFKFAVVRDPYTRTNSLLKHGRHFGVARNARGSMDFSGYELKFGREVVLEHDHRFAERAHLLRDKHLPHRVYGNILDERLDFVGRFESLAADMRHVQHRLGIARPFDVHCERSESPGFLTPQDCQWVEGRYAEDFNQFDYAPLSNAAA